MKAPQHLQKMSNLQARTDVSGYAMGSVIISVSIGWLLEGGGSRRGLNFLRNFLA